MNWIIYLLLAYLVYRLVTATKSAGSSKNKRVTSSSEGAPRRVVIAGRPAHEVLEVEPDASSDEIRRAYQQMIRQYHPDRVAGAAEELRELAETRSKEINAAYEALMSQAGE